MIINNNRFQEIESNAKKLKPVFDYLFKNGKTNENVKFACLIYNVDYSSFKDFFDSILNETSSETSIELKERREEIEGEINNLEEEVSILEDELNEVNKKIKKTTADRIGNEIFTQLSILTK